MGLGSAQRIRQAATWASWADCLEMVQARHPTVAAAMIEGITRNTQGCMGSVAQSAHALEEIGTEVPSWTALSQGARSQNQWPRERDPREPKHGWQKVASGRVHGTSVRRSCGRLSPTKQAQVRSQSGPLASVPLTALPVHRVSRMDSEPFRVVL